MPSLLFVTHPDVVVDPHTPVPDWGLTPLGSARIATFAASDATANVGAVWSSPERKAREAAAMVSAALDLDTALDDDLAEIDRSSTGFVEGERYAEITERFFAAPEASADGWERAADAQARVLAALDRIETAAAGLEQDVMVLAHGAVGALTLAARLGEPIAQALDQPRQGCWFAYDRSDGRVLHRWRELPDP